MKAKCPNCGSESVYRFVSVGAKQKLNGTRKLYEVGHGGLDNLFETCGCEKCEWTGDIYDIEGFEE